MTSCILAIGDPHFKHDNVEQSVAMTNEIEKYILSTEKIDAVVVLGDILHKYDKVDLFSLNRAIKFLRKIRLSLDRLEQIDDHIRYLWVLIGNHDRPNNSTFCTDEHAFNALKEWHHTYVADKPLTVEAGRSTPPDIFVLVPYVHVGRFEEALGGSDWVNTIADGERITAVFAHQHFKGANIPGNKTKEDIGDEYSKEKPLCISGHIHNFHCPEKNIYYTGTPYEMGWICLKNYKQTLRYGVHLFEFENEKLKGITIKNLKSVPINITIEYDSYQDFLENFNDNDGDVYSMAYSKHKNFISTCKNIKIRIKIYCKSEIEFKDFLKKSKAYKSLTLKDVNIIPEFNLVKKNMTTSEKYNNDKCMVNFSDRLLIKSKEYEQRHLDLIRKLFFDK